MIMLEVKLDVIWRFENGDSRTKLRRDLVCMKPLNELDTELDDIVNIQ